MRIVISWRDVDGLHRFGNMLGVLGRDEKVKVLSRAINDAGGRARTPVKSTLAKQAGLKPQIIHRALKAKRASWTDMSYGLTTYGGDIDLKFFKANETRKGVTAAPFGQRKLFAGSFMMGGRFPNRVRLKMGGQVFERVGQARHPIAKRKSGVVIPNEMVRGATPDAFERAVQETLPRRLSHHLSRATDGALS